MSTRSRRQQVLEILQATCRGEAHQIQPMSGEEALEIISKRSVAYARSSFPLQSSLACVRVRFDAIDELCPVLVSDDAAACMYM
jgi:hypothetical protein